MNDNYEVKGPVHFLEQRKPWKVTPLLEHHQNRDSFDIEFSPDMKVIRRTDYTYADHAYRSNRFVYDASKRLVHTVEFGATGIEVATSQFEYFEGKQICTARDPEGVVIGRYVDEYLNGLLAAMNTYDSGGQLKRLKQFEYKNGKVVRSISQYYGFDGKVCETSISNFDSDGRVIEAFGLTPDGKPNGDGRYAYEYDVEGRKYRVLSYNDLDVSNIPNHISGFLYDCDPKGNWTERREYSRSRSDSGWSMWVTTRKLIYYPS